MLQSWTCARASAASQTSSCWPPGAATSTCSPLRTRSDMRCVQRKLVLALPAVMLLLSLALTRVAGAQLKQRCTEVAPGVPPRVEGTNGSDWLVVDCGGTVVHVRWPFIPALSQIHCALLSTSHDQSSLSCSTCCAQSCSSLFRRHLHV